MLNVKHFQEFWRDDSAQSLVEYSVLLVYVTLFFVALIKDVGIVEKQIWTVTNTDLTQANTAAS